MDRSPLITETDSFSCGCSITGSAATRITTIKAAFGVAALPARRTDEATSRLAPVFPQAIPAGNVLATAVSNINAVLHVPAMVTNAGRVEDPESTFDFYGTGISPAVERSGPPMTTSRSRRCRQSATPQVSGSVDHGHLWGLRANAV